MTEGMTDESSPKRRYARDTLLLNATLFVEGSAEPLRVRVRNVSDGGMMVEGAGQFVLGREIRTELRGIGTVFGRIAWAMPGRAGVSFLAPIESSRVRVRSSGATAPLITSHQVDPRRPGVRSS